MSNNYSLKNYNKLLYKRHKKNALNNKKFKDPQKLKKFIKNIINKQQILPIVICDEIFSYIDDNFYIYSCLSNVSYVSTYYKNHNELYSCTRMIGRINNTWYCNISPNNNENLLTSKKDFYSFKTCIYCRYSKPDSSPIHFEYGFTFPNKNGNKKLFNNNKFICQQCLFLKR